MDIGKLKAFMRRLPPELSAEHRRIVIREYRENGRDFSYALNEAKQLGIEKGRQQVMAEMKNGAESAGGGMTNDKD